MALKKYKPTSPGRRFMATSGFEEITKSEPERSLLEPVTKKGGRNNRGRITTRHQGGGHKRRFRTIDFKRTKDGVPAKVAAIEYDPNRSARIALLHYADGVKAYILAPSRLQGRLDRRVGPRGGHQAGERPAAGQHPDGNARPLRRAQARTGRAHGALGGVGDPAGGQGRPARRAPAARPASSAASSSPVAPRWDRSGTRITRTRRAARPAGAAGSASGRPFAARP